MAGELALSEFSGRFDPIEKLGQGGMGVVYRVLDRSLGVEVALKVLHPNQTHALALTRFKREFRAASRLDHPACVRVFEMGCVRDRYYFTMQFLAGGSLADLRGATPPQVVFLARQVLAALDHIHSKQIVHRDIKPQNILLEDRPLVGGAEPRVKVSDFGIVKTTDSEIEASVSGFAGSLLYLSPEQLVEGHSDPRSDLYSLGVVLYELLAGRVPFPPPDRGGFRQWRWKRPLMLAEPLERLRPDLLAPLAAFVMRLIEPAPERRFVTAAAAFDEIERFWTPADSRTDRATLTRSSYLAGPSFIGRSRELAALESALEQALEPARAASSRFMLLVAGEAGIGKTRAVQRILRTLEARGVLICSGSCRAEGGNAFEPLSNLFAVCGLPDPRGPINLSAPAKFAFGDELTEVSMIRSAVATSSGLRAISDLSRAPEQPIQKSEYGLDLQAAAPPAEVSSDQPQPNWQLHRHVADTVLALSRTGPLVLLLEDVHWADASTLDLLGFLVRSIATARRVSGRYPIALLLTRRPSPEPQGLRALEETSQSYAAGQTIELCPLDLEATQELVSTMLMSGRDQAVESLGRFLHEHAEGNPLYACQMLHALHGSGRLRRVAEGWSVELSDVTSVELPTTMRRAIGDRASRFATQTKSMLASAAVLGNEFDLQTLASVSELEPLLLLDCLDEAIRSSFVLEVEGEAERFRFAHDRIREAIYEQFPPEEARELHRRAMLALERHHADSPAAAAALAHQSLACGELQKAYRYHVEAGRHAISEYAFAKASELLTAALEIGKSAGIAADGELHQTLGEASLQCGRYDLAEVSFRRRLETLEDPFQRAEILSSIAELEYRRGNTRASAELLEQVLRTVGFDVPKSRAGVLSGLVRNTLVVLKHAFLPGVARKLAAGDDLRVRQVISRACFSLPEVCYFHDILRAMMYNLAGLNVAEEIGPGRELANAHAQQSGVLAMYGLPRIGGFFQARADEALKAVSSPVDQAWAGIMRSLRFASMGLPEHHLAESLRACELLAKGRDPHRLREALLNVSDASLVLGRLDVAESCAREVARLAEELNDPRGKGWGLYLLGLCASRRGEHESAVSQLARAVELARQTDDLVFDLVAGGRLAVELSLHDKFDEALEQGLTASNAFAARTVRYPYLVVDGPFLIAAALVTREGGTLRPEVKRAVRRVRWLGRLTLPRPPALPLYWAGRAAWDVVEGRKTAGIGSLARGVQCAIEHGYRGELIHVHAVGAKILSPDEPAGRWHAQRFEALRAEFARPRPAESHPFEPTRAAS